MRRIPADEASYFRLRLMRHPFGVSHRARLGINPSLGCSSRCIALLENCFDAADTGGRGFFFGDFETFATFE